MLLLLVLLALGTAPVVHPDGRIAQFRIDRTTEGQIRAELGSPVRVDAVFDEVTRRRVGRALTYRCGRGCSTIYSISIATGKLSELRDDLAPVPDRARLASRHERGPGRSARGEEARTGLRRRPLRPRPLGPAPRFRPDRLTRQDRWHHVP